MIAFFDKIYTATERINGKLKKLKLDSFCRVIIRNIANIVLPVYFRFTSTNIKYSIVNHPKKEKNLLISLTSFPNRISRIWLVIESVLRQNIMPEKIILWLSSEQFSTIESLPKRLLKLQKRGLEIRLCGDDLRSHKKYYYAMLEYPDFTIVTLDDDVFYAPCLLKKLINLNKEYPNDICCNHASEIVLNNNEISNYLDWKNIKEKMVSTNRIIPIGVGGVLYPKNALDSLVFNQDVFRKYCFLADDIWLNMMSRLANTKVSKTDYQSLYLPVCNKDDVSLNIENNINGMNDYQLREMLKYLNYKRGFEIYDSIIKK